MASLAGKGAENGVVAEVDGKNRQDAGANDGEVAGRGSSVIRLATRALSAVRSSPGEYKNLLSWTRANYGDSYDPALSDHENAARALAGIGKRPGNLRGVAGVAFQRFRTAMDKSLKFGTDEESKKQTYKGVIYEGEGSEAKVLQRVSEEATRKMGTPVTLVPVRRDSLMFGDAGLGVLSEMERVFGKQIIFARETQERKSKTSGFSSESYNDALIVNADTPRPHLQVVGHELLHSMQRDAPDLYNQFIKAIEPEYKNLPLIEENVRKINATGGAQTTMDEEMGELPANIMGSEMLRPELWDKLKVRNPSIFGKVADYAVRWMGQLKDSVRDFLAKRPHAQWFINDIDATRNHIAALLSDYGERRQLMKRTETAQGRVPIVTLAGNMTLRTAPDTPRQREMDKAIAEVSTPAETTTAPAIPEHAPEVSGTTWHDVRRDPGKEFSIRDKPAYESEREFLDDYRENGKHDAGETVSEFLARRFCGGRSA